MIYAECSVLSMLIYLGQIFVASRLNVPGAWQMPQVGTLLDALFVFLDYYYYYISCFHGEI